MQYQIVNDLLVCEKPLSAPKATEDYIPDNSWIDPSVWLETTLVNQFEHFAIFHHHSSTFTTLIQTVFCTNVHKLSCFLAGIGNQIEQILKINKHFGLFTMKYQEKWSELMSTLFAKVHDHWWLYFVNYLSIPTIIDEYLWFNSPG